MPPGRSETQSLLWGDKARKERQSITSQPRPAHHANSSGTLFKCPWPSAEKPSWTELLRLPNPFSWYSTHSLKDDPRAREVNVVVPDWGAASLKTHALEREKCVIGTWLGHAGVMVELPLTTNTIPESSKVNFSLGRKDSLWILFDPIFSQRAGPTQYTGPGRFKNSPCKVEDLPFCDAVAISHNHYDHLDFTSIKAIGKRFLECKYFVPLGNGAWLRDIGIEQERVFEMDWWEERGFDSGFGSTEKGEESLRLTCVPAQHNSGRGTLDQGSTLWCGWVVEKFLGNENGDKDAPRKRQGAIYHAGDTGYRRSAESEEVCPAFQEIGEKLGPFDLSFVPIWRGGSLGFVSSIGLRLSHQDIPQTFHASPADAIAIHKAVKSRNSIGVHFGTFIGSEDESYEAIIEFDEAREEQEVQSTDETGECENGRVGTLDIGGSIAVEML